MTTIQEYLNQDKNTEYIYIEGNWYHSMLDGGELDLSDFPNVKKININGINLKPPLTKITLKNLTKLEELHLWYTEIKDLNFLNELPNPEKLKVLSIPNNNFPKSDLAIFERFTNLSELNISNMGNHGIKSGIYNRFEGKLTSFLKGISKLDYQNTLINK